MKTKITNKLLAVVTAAVMILMLTSLCFAANAASYDTANATSFVFSDSGITVTEGAYTGYKVSGTALSITEAGTYIVSGSCANGSIVVKKNVAGVTLILNGLDLTASATAPITCNKGSGVSIVAAAGTTNNLSDDKYNNDDYYTDEEAYPDIENAVIKCKDGSNVTICGTGTINVTAYGKNGVKGGADLYEEDADGNYTDVLLSTASLTIEDVTLNVSIKHSYKDPEDATSYDGDAIKSEKALNILSGNITVSANDDGIKCDYTLNIGAQGTDGPTIHVTKATEGIEGSVVNVYSGNVYVTATDDGINAANGDIADRSADFSYNQYGGYVYVNVTNGDALDSNGSANLAGGTLEVYAPSQGDGDPIDTEYGCTFGGATVLAVGHNAMMQNFSGAYVAFGGTTGGMGGFGGNTGGNLVTAGQTISITDASGNTMYTAKSTAPRAASYVVYASSSIASGGSYTLNGSVTATAGAFNGGMGQPGNMGGEQGQMSGAMGNEQGQFPGNQGQMPEGQGNTPGQFPGANGEQGQMSDSMGGEQSQAPGNKGENQSQFPGGMNGSTGEMNGNMPTPPDEGNANAQQPATNNDGAVPTMPEGNGGIPATPNTEDQPNTGTETAPAFVQQNEEKQEAESESWIQSVINWIISLFKSIFSK